MLVSVISFIAAAASIVLCIMECRRRSLGSDAQDSGGSVLPLKRSSMVWVVLMVALQVFLGVWSALGLVQDDIVSALIVNAVITGAAFLSCARPRLYARVRAIAGPDGLWPHPQVACALATVLAGIFATLALEIPSNHNLLWMYPLCLLLEVVLVASAVAGMFYLAQRRAGLAALLSFAFFAIGIAEYFVVLFKSQPIQPGDLTAIATAAAVGGGYTFTLSCYCLYGMMFLALSWLTLAYAVVLAPEPSQRTRKSRLINLVVGALCLAFIVCHVTVIDYYNFLRIQVYTWRPLESYYRQGFLPSFISSAQTIQPRKPEGYTKDDAEELVEEYAASFDEGAGASEERAQAVDQFEGENPSVIVVMNETFSDLSIYQNLHAGYEGPENFQSISDALQTGQLYVSAYGGGTCNTEFEVLTGNSMAYLGNGVYPYTIYNLTHAENLAKQFGDLGYATTAMHPNHATNWNRENVYADFGFDNFLSIEDFEGADTLRGMVTDEATYDKILELLNSGDDPQFIFDVTMQNHSGYTTGLLPMSMRTNYLIDGTYDAEVNEYLALIEESDRALGEFLNELEDLDRPVVVVFFGDHQPFFPSDYNDEWFTNEDAATHSERLYQTEYVIWANYDVAGRAQESDEVDLSSNYLGAALMELIGAPMTDYQKAQMALRVDMPAINSVGFQDAGETWHLTESATDDPTAAPEVYAAALKARQDLAMMQYLKLFDHGDSVYTRTLQGAANETDPNLAPGTTQIK